ncbi:MAG TPA: hypothetical protein VLG15_16625 [Thermoanaerobaculia bacterium]|nr:hypothetical protein [Thermoanaerobaculia bacterium]
MTEQASNAAFGAARIRRLCAVAMGICLAAGALLAQESGTAKGKGVIERIGPSESEMVNFAPRFSWAYREGTGSKAFTWVVLTEKKPPLESWTAAKDRAEARRAWCEKETTPWVAVKLDAKMKVDLYFLCPANGAVNTEMVSTANGLDSVVVKLEPKSGPRLKGTLRTGQGNCPTASGADAYCTPTGDYGFDAPLSK